ncbi:MAG: UDP-N-acetylmuramate:L-alanyl-gamma-D-glutamyl-meso-diaminopimelate ligase [candidate division KSB1 bacterium]|nr:UDP-N-acetylmuramate:L-alanyl-gamma-D-glutamyl-meso-diaminopimelate ligase [candidate division KSB1 bacterium]
MLNLSRIKSIYHIAICGTGMASLAAMLKNRGYRVIGSDENVYPPMSTFLEEQAIPIYQGFDAEHIRQEKPDLVVIGNAMSRGNPEVEFVLNEKIPYISLPAALREFFIRGRYSCVVTGTHGKTTTTSMLAWVLQSAGLQPGLFVGGLPENFGRGFQLGDGPHFVIEGDEYDSAFFDKGPKFLHYMPDLLIINNIEFDHADIYRNLDEIKTMFRRLVRIVPSRGHIIANADDPVVQEVVQPCYSNLHAFGRSAAAEWRADEIAHTETGSRFVIQHRGETVAEAEIALWGEHNVQNALAVFVAATQLGFRPEHILKGLRTFRGVRRRLTRIGEVDGMVIFDDFAHHATAIKETLKAVRSHFPSRRIWAIFEPRTASAKRKVFEKQFYAAFDGVDRVIIAPLHRPDKVPEAERLSVERILNALRDKAIPAESIAPGEPMLAYLSEHAESGDVFVFMSNGDFNSMPTKLWHVLNHKRGQ